MSRFDWLYTVGAGIVLVAFYAWLEVSLACWLLPFQCM